MKKRIILLFMISFIAIFLTSCNKKFTVNFDTDGGTTVAAVEVKKGETLEEPTAPTKDGYIFVEWQLDGKTYDFSQKVKSNFTLKAKWEQVVQLTKPTDLKIEDNILSWQAVEGAQTYDIYIDDELKATNLTTTTYQIPSEISLAYVYVVAKSKTGESESSEILNYQVSLSDEEWNQFLIDSGLDYIDDAFKSATKLLAIACKKYNVSVDDLKKLSSDEGVLELVLKYIEDERVSDLLSVVLLYASEMFNSQIHQMLADNVVNPEGYDEALQTVFTKLVNNDAYQTTFTKAKDDLKFVNLVAPCLAWVASYADNYTVSNVFDFLTTLQSLCPQYKLTRNDLTINFTNNITNESYTLTLDEIETLICYYMNNKDTNENENVIHTYFQTAMLYQKLETASINIYQNNPAFRKTIIQKMPQIGKRVQAIFQAYTTVMASNEDFQNLITAFQTADTREKLLAALLDAQTLKNNLVEVIDKALPTKEDIDILAQLVDTLSFSDIMYCMTDNANGGIRIEGIEYFVEYLKTILSTANTCIDFVTSIDTASYDIISIIEAYIMGNPEQAEIANAEIQKLIANLQEALLQNEDIQNFDQTGLYYIAKFALMTNGFNLDSQFSLVFGQAMDEELFNRLFDEMEELLEYISVDSAYAEQLVMMLYETIFMAKAPEVSYEVVCELLHQVFTYVDKDVLNEYKDLLVGCFEYYFYSSNLRKEMLQNNEEFDVLKKAEELYQCIYDNFETLKPFLEMMLQTNLIGNFETSSYEENKNILIENLNNWKVLFANSNTTPTKIITVIDLIEKLTTGEGVSAADKAFFNDALLTKIDQLLALVDCYSFALTTEQKNLIYDFEYYLNIDWQYPSIYELSVITQTIDNQTIDYLVVSIKEEIFNLYQDNLSKGNFSKLELELEIGNASYSGYLSLNAVDEPNIFGIVSFDDIASSLGYRLSELNDILNNDALANLKISYIGLNILYNGEESYFSGVVSDNITQYFFN